MSESDNPTPGDVFSTILDADTANELGRAWGGTSPIRLGFPDHTRIILLEAALGRLLAIEARHEGDGGALHAGRGSGPTGGGCCCLVVGGK